MQRREGDEVCVLLARLGGVGNCQEGVADLLDVDGLGEGGLLGIVALEMDFGLGVRDAVCRRRRVVAMALVRIRSRRLPGLAGAGRIYGWRQEAYLTCSLINSVLPAASSQCPRKSSPRNGFRGFFSLPYCSLLLAYCCLSVVRNHFSTSRARLAGSASSAGAANTEGCSDQYELNSVRLVEERMKGGAVRDERSPLKDAMDWAG